MIKAQKNKEKEHMNRQDPARFTEPGRTTSSEIKLRSEIDIFFSKSIGSNIEKLQNFAKFVPTQELRKFICRYELFLKVLDVHGSIIECGVLFGGGLMTWAQLSEIFEPINHTRNIIGFDTFSGFESLSVKDSTGKAYQGKKGGLSVESYDDLKECIRLFDKGRFLNHISKVKLVQGDVKQTLPKFLEENPHLVVSLLWLDFDIYEPTVIALKNLIDRIPRGGIIAFDELNHEVWPGETVAVREELGINKLRIQRFPFGGTLSYVIME
jgi:hypothetical protein